MVALAQDSKQPDSEHKPTGNLRHSNSIQQGVVIQRILFAKIQEPNVKDTLLSALARAWCDVQEERRKLAMRPLPRSVDVSKLAKRGRGKAQASEPAEPSNNPAVG